MKAKRNSIFSTSDGRNYLVPFALVTTLFFLWGFAHSILDVLNKHFQDTFEIGRAESALVQAVVYGGYFLMALPAGRLISRYGYRAGVLTGLVLYGVGALLFIPGSHINSFPFFLFSLFVIGCGLTCLETSANPYVTVLGTPSAAERRINLAQSFNGLGWIVGPLVGGLLIFGEDASQIALPYTIIGAVVRPTSKRSMGGSWVMNYVRPERLLLLFAVGAALTMALVCGDFGWTSIGALFACYLFESIMFPTIFSLALRGLGAHTKRGSSLLIMSIVGGAIAPVTMGLIADRSASMADGFIIPLVCFVAIGAYALRYKRLVEA